MTDDVKRHEDDANFTPLDVFVEIALRSDTDDIRRLRGIVKNGWIRLDFELERMPVAWIHKRRDLQAKIECWIAIENSLSSLWDASDGVPF